MARHQSRILLTRDPTLPYGRRAQASSTDLMPMSALNHGPHLGVCRALALLLAIEGGAAGVGGDEFKLVGGGSLEGHWLNRDDAPNAQS